MKHRDGWLRFLRRILQMPKEIKRLRAQIEDLLDTLAIREESIEWQADVISEMKNQKASLKDELHKAQSKIESLKLRVGELQDQLDNIRDSRADDKRLIKSLEEEIEKLREQIEMPLAPPSDIDTYEVISFTDMHSLIREKLGNRGHIYLSDGEFALFPKREIKRFLEWSKTDELKYVKTFFDCEQFSDVVHGEMSLPGWARAAFGIAWSVKHAFNVFVDADKELWVIEPQTDNMMRIGDVEDNDFYFPLRFLMI